MIPTLHAAHETYVAPRLLRLPEVMARTGLRRTSLYQRVGAGTFPQAVALTTTARAWLESEVQAWISDRVRERDAQPSRLPDGQTSAGGAA